MAMSSTAIAIYFLIWWIVLFAVLPWGVRAQGEDSPPGTDPGAPACRGSWPSSSGRRSWPRWCGRSAPFVYRRAGSRIDELAALLGFPP